jgi:osmotically inducible protein OsmC
VRASCALDAAALRITEIELVVRGRVRGLDAAAFADAADRAERLCPVSNALRGNVTVTVVPQLVAA